MKNRGRFRSNSCFRRLTNRLIQSTDNHCLLRIATKKKRERRQSMRSLPLKIYYADPRVTFATRIRYQQTNSPPNRIHKMRAWARRKPYNIESLLPTRSLLITISKALVERRAFSRMDVDLAVGREWDSNSPLCHSKSTPPCRRPDTTTFENKQKSARYSVLWCVTSDGNIHAQA